MLILWTHSLVLRSFCRFNFFSTQIITLYENRNWFIYLFIFIHSFSFDNRPKIYSRNKKGLFLSLYIRTYHPRGKSKRDLDIKQKHIKLGKRVKNTIVLSRIFGGKVSKWWRWVFYYAIPLFHIYVNIYNVPIIIENLIEKRNYSLWNFSVFWNFK